MRNLLFLALSLSTSAHAATLFALNPNHTYFSLISATNLSLTGNPVTVEGSIGTTNVSMQFGAVDGEVHFSGGNSCAAVNSCGTATGGYVTNSAQYLASRAAWQTTIAEIQALPATGSVPLIFSSHTFLPGVWNTSIVLFGNSALNFDAQGDPNAQFVVRGNSLSMSDTTQINLLNGAQASNVLFLSNIVSLDSSSPLSGIFLSTGNNNRFTGSSGDRLTLYAGTNLHFQGNLAGPAAVATLPLPTAVPEPSSALLCLAGAGLLAVRRWKLSR